MPEAGAEGSSWDWTRRWRLDGDFDDTSSPLFARPVRCWGLECSGSWVSVACRDAEGTEGGGELRLVRMRRAQGELDAPRAAVDCGTDRCELEADRIFPGPADRAGGEALDRPALRPLPPY